MDVELQDSFKHTFSLFVGGVVASFYFAFCSAGVIRAKTKGLFPAPIVSHGQNT